MAVKKERKIKVAVVGTGMAGLVTAYLLSHDEQNRYAVTLFEKVSSHCLLTLICVICICVQSGQLPPL